MKLLAIHSNKIFFRPASIEEPEVPNFYGWLAKERGFQEAFDSLDRVYKEEREKKPVLLEAVYDLLIKGMGYDELLAYCNKYNEFYFNKEAEEKLYKLRTKLQTLILISFPGELFRHLEHKKLAEVRGVEARLEDSLISGMGRIKIENYNKVREKMEKVGFLKEFTLESNRYGLLELLIDKMITENLSEEDIVVVGKDITAQPLHKVSARQFDSLDEVLALAIREEL